MVNIGPKTHISLSGKESERGQNPGAQSRYRNSPRSTLQSTCWFLSTSIRNVTSTAARTSSSIAPLLSPSSKNSPRESLYPTRSTSSRPVNRTKPSGVKPISTMAPFGYDRHGFEGYLRNFGENGHEKSEREPRFSKVYGR